MDVDRSFAAYVAARWSMLHRLAVLLAGPDRADELATVALGRAHASWRELHDPVSVDHAVQAILAREAARTGVPVGSTAVTTRAPSTSGGVWDQVVALAPRQRALLVLRVHEGFSDTEVAAALGCSRKAVAAELRAVEDSFDLDLLRHELHLRSDEDVAPHPPLDAILAAGREERRRRRRRSWRRAAVGAAGLAVVLVLANAVGGAPRRSDGPAPAAGPPRPQSLASLPAGGPPQIAYALGRSLHLASGTMVRLGEVPTDILQTRTWLYATYLSGAIVRIDPVSGDLQVAAPSSRGELATDPAGEHLAWLDGSEGSAAVVLRTVWDGAVALSDEQEFPARPHCCDNPFVVNGITTEGQVVTSLPAMGRAWVWTTPDGGTANQVREIDGLADGTISQVVAAGVVVEHPSLRYELGSIDAGRFVRTQVLRAQQADFADPLGRRVLYVDDDDVIHVRELADRGRSDRGSEVVRMGLPVLGPGSTGVRWEDSGHVLLDVADPSLPHGALVRCAVDSGRCEVAVRFERAHLVAD